MSNFKNVIKTYNHIAKSLLVLTLTLLSYTSLAQQHIEKYNPLKNDSIRVGTDDKDVLPYIQSGYILTLIYSLKD